MSRMPLPLAKFCVVATLGIAMTSPALGQAGSGSGRPTTPPSTSTVPRDVIQDRTRDRDRIDIPDQDRDRDRDRIDTPDQDRLRDRDQVDTPDRDRLRDRDPLYLGSQERLQTFDRDRDGTIDRAEFQQWHESAFDTIDANGEGGFNLAEFQAVRLGPGPNSDSPGTRQQRNEERAQLRKAERFRVMDGDGDGTVTRTEYMKFGELNYLDADANDDGRLTIQEMQQFHRGW